MQLMGRCIHLLITKGKCVVRLLCLISRLQSHAEHFQEMFLFTLANMFCNLIDQLLFSNSINQYSDWPGVPHSVTVQVALLSIAS